MAAKESKLSSRYIKRYTANGTSYSCCASNNSQLSSVTLNSLGYCFPVTVPTNDPFLNTGPRGVLQTCMNFVRSSTGPNRISCNFPTVTYADQVFIHVLLNLIHLVPGNVFTVTKAQSKYALAGCIDRLRFRQCYEHLFAKLVE